MTTLGELVWERTLGLTGLRATGSVFDVGGHSAAMVLVQHGLTEATGRELAPVEPEVDR